jgi:hypothetical protein
MAIRHGGHSSQRFATRAANVESKLAGKIGAFPPPEPNPFQCSRQRFCRTGFNRAGLPAARSTSQSCWRRGEIGSAELRPCPHCSSSQYHRLPFRRTSSSLCCCSQAHGHSLVQNKRLGQRDTDSQGLGPSGNCEDKITAWILAGGTGSARCCGRVEICVVENASASLTDLTHTATPQSDPACWLCARGRSRRRCPPRLRREARRRPRAWRSRWAIRLRWKWN